MSDESTKKDLKQYLEAYTKATEASLNKAFKDSVAYGYGFIIMDRDGNLHYASAETVFKVAEKIKNAKAKFN